MRHVVRAQVRLPLAADAVWAVLHDLRAWPEWDPYILALRPLDADGPAEWTPGVRWRECVRRGPFRPAFGLTTMDAGPGAVGWRARYLWVCATHRWWVRAEGSHTVVESEEVFEGWGPVIVIAAALFRVFRVSAMAAASLRAPGEQVRRKTKPGAPSPRVGQEADRASE